MQTFAQQLSALRKERGVTQEQLAQELNVSRTTISRWESGKVLPDIESIKRLSQVLNYNFFTVEGLGQDLPVAEETPVEQEPAEKKKGPARWIMAGAAALIVLCVAMALLLGGRTSPAELVAASTGKVPLPQKGSTRIRSLFQGVSIKRALARVSVMGAFTVICR